MIPLNFDHRFARAASSSRGGCDHAYMRAFASTALIWSTSMRKLSWPAASE